MADLHGQMSMFWTLIFQCNSLDSVMRLKKMTSVVCCDKILLNVTKMIISVFDRIENIVGKGEIVCTSNFSFSYNVFKRLLSKTRQKVSLCGNGLTKRQNLKLKLVQIDNI